MLSFHIPFIMVVAFLLLTLAAGLYFSRRKTTFREFAIGNKQFATATLVATVLASEFRGDDLIAVVESTHQSFLYYIIMWSIGSGLAYWFLSVLALRMGPFMTHLSMPETIGKIYGRYPRLIVALCSIVLSIGVIALQISIVSQTLAVHLGFENPKLVTIFVTLVFIFYSAFGGVRAILFTDVLQLTTFAGIIPLLACFLFLNTGKTLGEVVSFLSIKAKLEFVTFWDIRSPLNCVLLLLGFIAAVEPMHIQRIYLSSSPIQARNVFRYVILFTLVILFFIILIGLFVLAAVPALPRVDIWGYIITHIPPIFKGFIPIALLAMAMSSADSYLNAAAVIISHDIVESIRGEKPYPHSLQIARLARLATLAVGLVAMVLVFYTNDLRAFYTVCFYPISIVAAPFILAVYGFRSSSRTALIGMGTTILAIIIWEKWIKPTIVMHGGFICMVANGLAMLAAHYLLPQSEGSGWVGPDDTFRQVQQAKERRKKRNKKARAYLIRVMIALTLLTGVICLFFTLYG